MSQYIYNTVPSSNPLNTNVRDPVQLTFAARDPNAQDNVYPLASEWQNTVNGNIWQLISITFNNVTKHADANWKLTSSSSSAGILSVAVQTGTSPILPNGSGQITINGAVVAAGTNPVRTDGTGANALAVEVQTSQAIAATDATKIGLSNFNSAQFTVDANGFVSLAGGGAAVDSFTTNIPGPVSPDGTGNINVNASVTTFTDGSVANTIKTEVQGTNHALFVGRGSNVAVANLSVGATGTVLIGTTGADPSFSANPTVNSLTFTGALSTGTQTALTVYTEGTWTPELRFAGAAPVGITYSTQQGTYTRIGRVVFIEGVFVLTSKGAQAGTAGIFGLPFTSANNVQAPACAIIANNITPTAGSTDMFFQINANSTTGGWTQVATATGASTNLQDTNFANNSSCQIDGFYFV